MLNIEGRNPLNNVDASAPSGETIILRVKSSNHPSCEDLEFPANTSFSVKEIKEMIQRLCSVHPEVKEQRLIYAGHLLNDNQVLKDVLNAKAGGQYSTDLQQPVTVHLACTSKYISTPKTVPKPQERHGEGLPQQQGVPSSFDIPQVDGNSGIPQDYMSLHNAYVEQMTAYMNQWYMQQGAFTGGMWYHQPPTENYNVNVQPHIQQNHVGEAIQPEPVPQPPPRNVIAAARAPDNEENQRDLLDWMYTFSRVILMLSVVYFYSSFSRFFLVVMFTALVMVLQRRNGPPLPAGANRVNHNNPAPPQNENAENNEQDVRDENDQDEEEFEEQPATEAEFVPPPPPERGLKEIAWTFLVTFFTSLIPDNPHH